METGGWSLGADKAATQLIGRPSKYLTSVKNFNMNYPRKQGNTQPCGNYESAFCPILKVHNLYECVVKDPNITRLETLEYGNCTNSNHCVFLGLLRHCFL